MKCFCLFFFVGRFVRSESISNESLGVSISEQLSQWASKPGLVQNLRRVSWSRVHTHRIHGMVYLPTFSWLWWCSCREIYQAHGSYGMWRLSHDFIWGCFNRSYNNAPGGALGTTKQWVNQAFNGCAFHTIWAIKIQTFVGLGFSWGLYYPVMYEATSIRKSKKLSFVAHLSLKIYSEWDSNLFEPLRSPGNEGICPLKYASLKRKGSSSNHPFSGASC